MDNERQIAAIAWAAHKEGLSYGQKAAQIQSRPGDMWKILTEHKAYLQERRVAHELKKREQRAERRAEKRKAISLKRRPKPEPPPVTEEKDRGGRPMTFNPRAARALYDEGYNDAQIANELGTEDYNIRRWRTKLGLPPRGKKAKAKKAAP